MHLDYYYNNVPGKGKCRNNLIYTSLISRDKKTFVKWFHNDTEYHKGKNQVVRSDLMKDKFNREVNGLLYIKEKGFDNIIPKFDIDFKNQKIFFEINGVDLWELAGCKGTDYSHILSDWDTQMLKIFDIYQSIGLYKYSLHPSSYFVINGELKSINYFFSYIKNTDDPITVESVLSHISKERQQKIIPKMQEEGIDLHVPTPHIQLQFLAFESFKSNFRADIMDRAKEIYKKLMTYEK
jgi:hypothetical protein